MPGERREEVKVLEYSDQLKIFHQGTCLAEYPLPPDGREKRQVSPPGPASTPAAAEEPPPRRAARGTTPAGPGPEVEAYLDYALQVPGVQRHRLTRELFVLSRQVTGDVFLRTVERALRYRIVQIETLRRIAWLCISQDEHPLPQVEVDEDFQQRPAYQEGRLTEEPDLSIYNALFEEDDRDDENPSADKTAGEENG